MWMTRQLRIQQSTESSTPSTSSPTSHLSTKPEIDRRSREYTVSSRSFGQAITMKMYRENRQRTSILKRASSVEETSRKARIPRKTERSLSRLLSSDSTKYPARVHVQSSGHPKPSEALFLCYLRTDPSTHRMPLLSAPRNPTATQETLQRMIPTISHVQYACPSHCRSRGICVHMSFLLSCRALPDGLICRVCRVSGINAPITAERPCARHNAAFRAGFAASLIEDVLATEEQAEQAGDLWRRAWENDWAEFPGDRCRSPSGSSKIDQSGD